MKNYKKYIKEINENDPYGEEDWEDNIYFTFDEFYDISSDYILDKFNHEYRNYAYDDQNAEDFYYANVKYWSNLLKKEIS
jgi:hypothetical protein